VPAEDGIETLGPDRWVWRAAGSMRGTHFRFQRRWAVETFASRLLWATNDPPIWADRSEEAAGTIALVQGVRMGSTITPRASAPRRRRCRPG
jgi:hypothetical protein